MSKPYLVQFFKFVDILFINVSTRPPLGGRNTLIMIPILLSKVKLSTVILVRFLCVSDLLYLTP